MAARRKPTPREAVEEGRKALKMASRLAMAPLGDPAVLLALHGAVNHTLRTVRTARELGPADPKVEVEAREAVRALLLAVRSGAEAALATLDAPPPPAEGSPLMEVLVEGHANPGAPPMARPLRTTDAKRPRKRKVKGRA